MAGFIKGKLYNWKIVCPEENSYRFIAEAKAAFAMVKDIQKSNPKTILVCLDQKEPYKAK